MGSLAEDFPFKKIEMHIFGFGWHMKLTNAHAECTYEVCTGGMGVHMKLSWRNGCTCEVLAVNMMLSWISAHTWVYIWSWSGWMGVHMQLPLQFLRHKCGTAQISTFNKTGLKGHFHHSCRRYHKGSSLFLLVEVGGRTLNIVNRLTKYCVWLCDANDMTCLLSVFCIREQQW